MITSSKLLTMYDYKTVRQRKSTNFRRLIDRLELKQRDIAQALDMQEANISDMLRGKRTISDKTIGAFCKFYDVDPAEFFTAPDTPLITDNEELEIIKNVRKYPEYKNEIMILSEILPQKKYRDSREDDKSENCPVAETEEEKQRKTA